MEQDLKWLADMTSLVAKIRRKIPDCDPKSQDTLRETVVVLGRVISLLGEEIAQRQASLALARPGRYTKLVEALSLAPGQSNAALAKRLYGTAGKRELNRVGVALFVLKKRGLIAKGDDGWRIA